jgi:MFS family permease
LAIGALPAHGVRNRWFILLLLAAGYILVYFHRLCPAVLAVDMMRDLGAGGTLFGLLGAAYFYPYAVMQIPAGLLSDSWGPRKSISLFLVIAFAGCLLLASATGPASAIAGRTLVGLGVSVFFVPALKLLAEWFLPQEFALTTGLLLAAGGIGMLVATEPLGLLDAWIGWRSSFAAIGILTLAVSLLVWLLVRDRPPNGERPPAGPRPAPHAPRPTRNRIRGGRPATMRDVLAHGPFWPAAAWFFCMGGIVFAFGGLWAGPYLMHVYGLDPARAGRVLSMLAIGMILGAPFASILSDRVFFARKPVIVLASILLALLTGLLAFRTDRIPLGAMYVLCFFLSVSSNAVAGIAFTIAKEMFPSEIAGTAMGLLNLFPFAGAAVFQPLLGAILERGGRVEGAFAIAGYEQAFFLLFLCGVGALASSLLLRETLASASAGRGS